MAMSASSMRNRIKAYFDASSHAQTSDAGQAQAYSDRMLLDLCRGIIDEIVQNAVVTTTSGAPDSEHIGKID